MEPVIDVYPYNNVSDRLMGSGFRFWIKQLISELILPKHLARPLPHTTRALVPRVAISMTVSSFQYIISIPPIKTAAKSNDVSLHCATYLSLFSLCTCGFNQVLRHWNSTNTVLSTFCEVFCTPCIILMITNLLSSKASNDYSIYSLSVLFYSWRSLNCQGQRSSTTFKNKIKVF